MKHLESLLNWDEYYLFLAFAASLRSKDPNSKVGSVVVNGSSIVTGYNGFPKGVADLESRWQRPDKYSYVIHAEDNALANARFDTHGSTIYITHNPPCNDCTKRIIQHGIVAVVCGNLELSALTKKQSNVSLQMLKEANIPIRIYDSRQIYDRVIETMILGDWKRK